MEGERNGFGEDRKLWRKGEEGEKRREQGMDIRRKEWKGSLKITEQVRKAYERRLSTQLVFEMVHGLSTKLLFVL